MDELRELGVKRVEECVRLGASVMVGRCIAEFRRRDGVGRGWLAAAVRDGGSWFEGPQPAAGRKTASELLRAIDQAGT
jgi:hypothetical protein